MRSPDGQDMPSRGVYLEIVKNEQIVFTDAYTRAKSIGRILDLLRALKAKDGGRQTKLFQFLNDVGARALRMQLGRVLEMCESSSDKAAYEKKIVERFGG